MLREKQTISRPVYAAWLRPRRTVYLLLYLCVALAFAAPRGRADSILLPPAFVVEATEQTQDTPSPGGPPVLGIPYITVDDVAGTQATAAHFQYMDRFSLWPVLPNPRSLTSLHFFADGGFLMVHSYISNNLAFIEHGPALKTIPKSNFNYDVNFAPRVTLGGVADNGFGVRGTWWQLDEATTTGIFPSTDAKLLTSVSSIPIPGLPGFTSPGAVAQKTKIFNDKLEFDNHLHLTVADLEGFKDFSGETWSVLVGTGARYLFLSQNYDGFRSNSGKRTSKTTKTTFNLKTDTDYLTTGRSFAGAGLTDFIEVRRRILPGFSLYASARGSVLWGDTGTDSYQLTTENLKTTPPKGKSITTLLSTSEQLTVPGHRLVDMGDFEAGMDTSLLWGRTILFMRAGVADQTLFAVGSATNNHGNISFFGLRFSAGISY